MHKFMKSDGRAITPNRAHKFDAGTDLYALEDVQVKPGQVLQVKTGIHLALNNGETCLFWDKSGRALAGLTILGGCIDGPYRGELLVTVANVNIWPILNLLHDKYAAIRTIDEITVRIPYGKSLTQMIIVDTNGINFNDFEEISKAEFALLEPTDRGTAGFGSSDDPNFLMTALIVLGEQPKKHDSLYSVYNKGSYFELNWGYEEGFGYRQRTEIKNNELFDPKNYARIKGVIEQMTGMSV
jgi:dUTP pyrophosphatase